MQSTSAFAQLVDSINDKVTHVSIEQYQADDKWVLIDVREDHEWLQGHLPNAKHLGKGIIERDIETRFPDKSTPLLLYCGGGHRSSLAAYNIQLMGYTQVGSLVGGFKTWVQHQFPVVQD
ncbi:rhodanese-like domain-containing protein [Shewanella sp. OMA3-2]|uniref:rhodanese-like domain-containing protein n=1 Tax=Shewanella sp. OMA3-2 TaxID=2908650 RepID=UPI001F241E7A|nr:rhodanese-like domain-containing protein [Shewanella sp. OMA3-2]UJF23169.1 sulfurtransferase [Shewanella sp. OMA3-2]